MEELGTCVDVRDNQIKEAERRISSLLIKCQFFGTQVVTQMSKMIKVG